MIHTSGDQATEINHLSTREGYDRWAAIYDDDPNPLVMMEQPHVDRLLGDVRGLSVADVGCGTGRHAMRLAAAGANVTALDFSGEMLSRARAKTGADRVHFIQHDLTQPLPLEDRSFDRVLCGLVLDHIPDLACLFAQFKRITRDDGFIVISVVHPALMLRGVSARFTDPVTGSEIRPQSCPHQISDYVTASLGADVRIDHISEHAVDEALAARCPRAEKYLGWPLLLVMKLRPGA